MFTSASWYFLPILIILSLASTGDFAVPLQHAKQKYKIGMLLPFASQSHRNCFLPLAKALADRGHEIVILSGLPPRANHPNITEINHGTDYVSKVSVFDQRQKGLSLTFFTEIFPKVVKQLYDVPEVMNFYNERKNFDLFIVDALFNEVAYPFLEGVSYASIATSGYIPAPSAVLGNVLNPAYVSLALKDFPRPYTLMQRMENLIGAIMFNFYYRHYAVFPVLEEALSTKFPNLPPLVEIEKGLGLMLANTHFSISSPIPSLPSQLEVGGMHCHPGKPLPKNLETFIDGAGSDGVIYFSLGSVCQGKSIPEEYRKVLIETFSNLKQRIIWKFEEDLQGLPKNIMISKWLPQQDILAHPNVKMFITHGGLLSLQEAIYHQTPLLAIPVVADQDKNGQYIENKGIGHYLVWEDLTTDLLTSTINEIIINKKYENNIKKMSVSFRDQPTPPLEKAIWWVEYFIRHKGAPQLRSPAADISWVEYLMIDVIICIHLVVFIIYWITKKIIIGIFRRLGSSKSSKEQKRKKNE